MKLYELLKEKTDDCIDRILLTKLTKIPYSQTIRIHQPIEIGNYKLSIQCSYGHYCYPRFTLKNYSVYKSMELAVLGECDFIPIHLEVKELEFLEPYFEGSVYAQVPVDLLEQMINILEGENGKAN